MTRPFGEVYLLTNTVNGKQYVGQTTRGAKYRWRDHQHDAKRRGNKSVLGRAIRKYGATSFTITVLDFAYDPSELDAKEIHWISTKGTLSPNGYNVKPGGQKEAREASRRVRLGATTPDSVRQKLREANLGRKHTGNSRQSMSEGQHRRWSAKGFLSFQELRGIVRGLNLNGAREYFEYAKTQAGFPTSPSVMYKNEWGGWSDFLGHVQRLSYAEAVRWVEPQGLRCAREYHEYLDSHSPPGLPKYPDVSYTGEGWTGWAEFLGPSRFVPYQEAMSTVQPMGFSGSKAYMAWVRDTHPKGFPSWPSKTYKGAGWVSWEVYLGKSPEVTEA